MMVPEDQLSLAIGRRGQNVRLASKLVGWDMEIMTEDELSESIEKAEGYFKLIPGMTDDMVEVLISEGFLSYDDLTFQETADLAEMLGVTEEEAINVINFAEEASEELEKLNEQNRELPRKPEEILRLLRLKQRLKTPRPMKAARLRLRQALKKAMGLKLLKPLALKHRQKSIPRSKRLRWPSLLQPKSRPTNELTS
ncbi:MAG: hypothetical protein QM703_12370 [Gemmatales bacterium]